MTDLPARWLVTGGCGFIGSALVRHLGSLGVRSVRVVDNLSRGQPEALPPEDLEIRHTASALGPWGERAQLLVADIGDRDAVREAARGARVIVHLAANAGVVQSIEDPIADLMVNVAGTLNVLEAARFEGVPRVVIASSAAAVGSAEPPIREDTLPRPSTPYGAGKLCTEAYAAAYAQTFGLETVALRFGNVYGPNSEAKDSVVARFVKQWLAGETLVVYGDGRQTRDFIFLPDLLDAILRGATRPGAGGRVFQIATSRETSVNELAEALVGTIRTMGLEPPRVTHGPERVGDVRRTFSDTSAALEVLGWCAGTSLDEGLRHTVQWFIDQHEAGE